MVRERLVVDGVGNNVKFDHKLKPKFVHTVLGADEMHKIASVAFRGELPSGLGDLGDVLFVRTNENAD